MSVVETKASRALMLAKADEIATAIADSEEARRFWQARAKMERHDEAQKLFGDLKRKTNALLTLQERLGEKHEKYQRIQAETDALWDRLAEIPVALQYKAAQDELNALLQEVTLILLARLREQLPVERGPRQCGSGGCSGGCGGSCGVH
ncbi:cell fate (sporulation/competence/biofilm development) regulator YmcA (YheA/YmcA/DUF963 family) [Alicyclobacillus sacchari]|uniref:Cell fate (Sporulation/competence/biofilm development) regulator YmcA (YheA/YmcA/DUF963 family) n=1 Tax=Alicyclobacillus sacchari TaxID=392010 RepID=A0A4R8LTT7_9BACL|nr:YlbF family regulator [Alicyclobacillus sacchari]TDY50562.1 cell fate (sporulation/competence/biofilm development) regulator YmcA (YheA/YmcA/DUF963 family) [Alicyclobacillus sacchari]